MAVSLLIAPPASGKTQYCIQKVRTFIKAKPFSNAWVVLPDRRQAAAFRRRLAQTGGAMGIQVGTFGTLYEYFLNKSGQPVPLASGPIIHRLLQEAVQQVKEKLTFYRAIADTPGFILELRQRFGELKRALVYPEEFSRAVMGVITQEEIALIYTAYQDILRSQNWADQEGLSWLAVEALMGQPSLAAGLDFLAVDGFEAFEGGQLNTLKLLADAGMEILITLPGDKGLQRQAHRRFQRGLDDLAGKLGDQVSILEHSSKSMLPPLLAHLEAHLFGDSVPPVPGPSPQALEMYACRTPVEEAHEALRWIKARILREGFAANECAVFTPQADLYAPHLRAAARSFGLPLFFYHGQPLLRAPIVTALLGLLNLSVNGFPAHPLLDALRSPFIDMTRFNLKPGDIETLDLVRIQYKIISGLQEWQTALANLEQKTNRMIADPEEEFQPPDLPTGIEAIRLKNSLESFISTLAIQDEQDTIAGWVKWLEDCMIVLGCFERMEAINASSNQGEQEAVTTLGEILRALILGDQLAGERRIDYAGFLTTLQGAVESAAFTESTTHSYEAVQVGHLMDSRGLRFKAVAVLGLAEGIFPEKEREDPWLDENLRKRLNLDLRLQREQAGLFYQVITRSDRRLLLTRPYLADNGEPWPASPYWSEVENFFLKETAEGKKMIDLDSFPGIYHKIQPETARPLEEAASIDELLLWAARQGARLSGPLQDDFAERAQYLQHAQEVLSARSGGKAAGVHEGDLSAIAATFNNRYHPEYLWSATALETYGTCPFRFFVEKGLDLRTPSSAEPGLDAAQLGSLYHLILEDAYRLAEDPGDAESVLACLPRVAQEHFTKAPEVLDFRPSALWEQEKILMMSALRTTIRALADYEPGWKPIGFEKAFGKGDQPDALRIDLEQSGPIRLSGVIDRLDQDENGSIRVVDYKTGSSHLEKSDLLKGRRLQLPLYALAAHQVHGYPFPIDGFYWAIQAAEPGGLKLKSFNTDTLAGPEGALDVVIGHLDRIVSGIRSGKFPPIPPSGGCPSYCAAAAWCWRSKGEAHHD